MRVRVLALSLALPFTALAQTSAAQSKPEVYEHSRRMARASESPRSGRQRKAWGVSPRPRQGKRSKSAKRAAAESSGRMLGATAITRFAGSIEILVHHPGAYAPVFMLTSAPQTKRRNQ